MVAEGRDALRSADWRGARVCFEAALKEEDSAEAHDGLGLALWWLNDVEGAHRERSLAFVGFKKIGEFGRAAVIAAWLGREQVFLSGNSSGMKGWFARAARLLGEVGQCAEQGWFLILRASMMAAPEELEEVAAQAIEVGRQFDDADLEAFALSLRGWRGFRWGK